MDQLIVVLVILITIYAFFQNKWRYDVIAFGALVLLALISVVAIEDVFYGFSHPALFLVVSVLVISKGLANSGFADIVSFWLYKLRSFPILQLFLLTLSAVTISAFINNSGALALLLPVAIKVAHNSKRPTSFFLIPLAFSTLFGGIITLTGTPSNIIISSFRENVTGAGFGYFEFALLGIPMAIVGILYLLLFGRSLLPKDQNDSQERVDLKYTSELLVTTESISSPQPLRYFENKLSEGARIASTYREGHTIDITPETMIKTGDIITIFGTATAIKTFIGNTHTAPLGSTFFDSQNPEEYATIEAIVTPHSKLNNESAKSVGLYENFNAGLIAINNESDQPDQRISNSQLTAGDTVLLVVPKEKSGEIINQLRCLPLEEQDLRITHPRKIVLALSIVATSIILSITGLIPTSLAFIIGVFGMGATNLISLKDAYDSIDWPSIVMLGSMLSLVNILEHVGAFSTLATTFSNLPQLLNPIVVVLFILIITIFLTNIIDNTAVAVLLAPIVVQISNSFGGPLDAYLMAIVLGSIAAFMTPFGEHPNLLVMKPGNYSFQDYWRVGLPLTLLFIAAGVPLIIYLWG